MTFSKNRRKSKKLGEGFSGLSPIGESFSGLSHIGEGFSGPSPIGEGFLFSPKTFSYRRKSNFKFLPLLNERCHINQRKTQDFLLLLSPLSPRTGKSRSCTTIQPHYWTGVPKCLATQIRQLQEGKDAATLQVTIVIAALGPQSSTDGIDMGKSSRTKIDSRAKTNRVDSVRFLWVFLSKTTAGYKTVSSTLLLSEKENPEGTEPSQPDLSLCDLYSLRGEALPQQNFPRRLSEFLEHSTPSQLQTDITITNQPSAGAS